MREGGLRAYFLLPSSFFFLIFAKMVEQITIPEGLTKEQRYESLLTQIYSLVEGEKDWLACSANVIAALKDGMGFFWIGIYRVVGGELLLGPFQGPVACIRIGYGQGVCGTCWKENKTIVVPDVDLFPGHIACSALSRSEIVVPIRKNSIVTMVLDVDSVTEAAFDDTDARYLEKISEIIARLL